MRADQAEGITCPQHLEQDRTLMRAQPGDRAGANPASRSFMRGQSLHRPPAPVERLCVDAAQGCPNYDKCREPPAEAQLGVERLCVPSLVSRAQLRTKAAVERLCVDGLLHGAEVSVSLGRAPGALPAVIPSAVPDRTFMRAHRAAWSRLRDGQRDRTPMRIESCRKHEAGARMWCRSSRSAQAMRADSRAG